MALETCCVSFCTNLCSFVPLVLCTVPDYYSLWELTWHSLGKVYNCRSSTTQFLYLLTPTSFHPALEKPVMSVHSWSTCKQTSVVLLHRSWYFSFTGGFTCTGPLKSACSCPNGGSQTLHNSIYSGMSVQESSSTCKITLGCG